MTGTATGRECVKNPRTLAGTTGMSTWWPPQAGDVARFWEKVDGNDPVPVVVAWRHTEHAWTNVMSGGVLPLQPEPDELYLLLRHGLEHPDA